MKIATRHPLNEVILGSSDCKAGSELAGPIREAGFEIIETCSGEEVMNIASERPGIGMMILDTGLEDLNGYEVTYLIKQQRKMKTIILLLGWFSVHSLELAYTMGCDEFLAKPVTSSELLEVMNKWKREE